MGSCIEDQWSRKYSNASVSAPKGFSISIPTICTPLKKKKKNYFKNEEKSYRKTSGNYITIFSQNVSLEKYKYCHGQEWRGGEAGPVEMFAKKYLTAPWKPTLVSFQRLGKYLWKFTSSVGRLPARLPVVCFHSLGTTLDSFRLGYPGETGSVSAAFPFCLLINSLFSNHFPGRLIQVLLYRLCEASAGRGDNGHWRGELLTVVSSWWANIESPELLCVDSWERCPVDGTFTI